MCKCMDANVLLCNWQEHSVHIIYGMLCRQNILFSLPQVVCLLFLPLLHTIFSARFGLMHAIFIIYSYCFSHYFYHRRAILPQLNYIIQYTVGAITIRLQKLNIRMYTACIMVYLAQNKLFINNNECKREKALSID